MDFLITHWEWLAVAGGLLALLVVAIVAIVNVHGRKLDRHQDWMRRLELSLGNLHKERTANHARSLQIRIVDGGPPTLSEAQTTEVTADMLSTLRLDSKRKDERDG